MKKLLRSYGINLLGSLLYSLAFVVFFQANQVAMAGVTGLAQVGNALFPILSVGLLTFLFNVPIFLVGWRLLGFHLLASSLFSMAVSSAAIDLFGLLLPVSPMDPLLASLCGGALMGFGVGLVFSQGATTGGTDIIARLLKLKLPWLPLGRLVLIPDLTVLALVALAFGRLETALYGGVAMFVSSRVLDTVLYGMDVSKVAYIVSDRWQAIADALLHEQGRGVTILQGEGAFLIVCDAREVMGEGFGHYGEAQ